MSTANISHWLLVNIITMCFSFKAALIKHATQIILNDRRNTHITLLSSQWLMGVAFDLCNCVLTAAKKLNSHRF